MELCVKMLVLDTDGAVAVVAMNLHIRIPVHTLHYRQLPESTTEIYGVLQVP